MDEIKITDIAAKKIWRRIFNSIFVVDKVWKIKHGDPIWVSKKPNVFSWISILNLDTAKPKNINKKTENAVMPSFEIELTASVLAYEIARSDGDVSEDELSVLMMKILKTILEIVIGTAQSNS